MSETSVPAACPKCGRLSAMNERHCTEKDKRPGWSWFKSCRAMRCKGCELMYHAQTPKIPGGAS